jgi:hypothetical protein
MALTEQDIQDYVRRKLGDGVVCVELTDNQIDDAINRAKLWAQGWIGQGRAYLITFDGTTEYVPPTDCESVTEVVFTMSGDSLFDMFKWAGVELNIAEFTMVRPPGGGYTDLVQHMQYLKLGQRVMSAERSWEWDRVRNRLVISPAPASGEKALIYYLAKTLDLTYLRSYEQALVQDYALAGSMETLGYIRTKYAEIPTASGSTTMNGDTLLGNASQLFDKLNEQARNLTPPLSFITG